MVDTAWLASHRDAVAVVDVRYNSEAFMELGHIPGAVFIDWHDIRATRIEDGVELVGMLPGPEDFAQLMRRAGISDGTQVVIVNGGRNSAQVTAAARLYWQLKYYGHDAVALLDGGKAAWKQAGLPISHDAPVAPPPGTFAIGDGRPEFLATLADVDTALDTGSAALYDAREFGPYFGLYHSATVTTGGHIPGAGFAPSDAFLTPGPVKRFLDDTTLRRAMTGLGADGPAIVYCNCNTGHFAAGTWFCPSRIGRQQSSQPI
ncbi:sulfurtransferase [Jhaorihella thermophila]